MAELNKRVESELSEIFKRKRVRQLTPTLRLQEDLHALRNTVMNEGRALWLRAIGNKMTQADTIVVAAAMLVGGEVLRRLPQPGVKITVQSKLG